jgi:hypothetical protein
VVHAWVDAVEHFGEKTALRHWLHASLLCPVVGCHPLEEPRIGLVVASDFQVDEHAPPHERRAMLESFLACTRRDTKRRETEALRNGKHLVKSESLARVRQ